MAQRRCKICNDVIKDVCEGLIFYARNIHKCRPGSAAYYLRPPRPPIRGSMVSTYEKVIEYLKHPAVAKVLVLAGAGISTPCGIPDFRSPGTGLYYNVGKYGLPFSEAIFDIRYFFQDPKPFFNLAKDIYPGKIKPGVAHYFVKLLDQKGKLLRMYTQNVDGLEKLAGIPSSKLIESHGSFETATCCSCGAKYTGDSIKGDIFSDKVPVCREENCCGVIKPDITFLREILPAKFNKCLEDLKEVDLMIIIGTSLSVWPFADLAHSVPDTVPRLLLNQEDVFKDRRRQNDIIKTGDIQVTIPDIVQRLGWSRDLEDIMQPNASE